MIRVARPEDRSRFLRVWHDFLGDNAEAGGPILPTPRTLEFFAGIFDWYARDPAAGVCLLADGAKGGLLWGAPGPLPYDVAYGRAGEFAFGWGTYVPARFRRQGIARSLQERGAKELRERGFRRLVGGHIAGHQIMPHMLERFDYREVEVTVCFDL